MAQVGNVIVNTLLGPKTWDVGRRGTTDVDGAAPGCEVPTLMVCIAADYTWSLAHATGRQLSLCGCVKMNAQKEK